MHTGNYLVKYLSIFARSTLLVLMFSWAGAQASPDAVTRAPWSAFAHTSFRHHPVSAGGVFTQDNSGFVWLGTQSGLVRWDGYRMRRYVANPADPRALRDGYILSLHIDAGGRFWIGTSSGGLARYDAGTDNFTTYAAGPGGVSHVSVMALADDGAGGVWIGTGGGLDHMSRSGQLTTGTGATGTLGAAALPEGGINALLLDRQGTLWLGTGHGLFRRTKGSTVCEPFPSTGGAPGDLAITRLYQDSAGRIWAGTRSNGALVIAEGAAVARPVHESGAAPALGRQRVFSIVEVTPAEIWLGTEGAGIVAVNPVSGATRRIRRRLSSPDSLFDDDVHALFRERSGLVFVATPDAMSLYDPHASAMVTVRDAGLAAAGNMSVQSMLLRPDGRVWLGVAGGGIEIVDPIAGAVGRLVPGQPRADNSLPSGRVLTMSNGPDGAVYIGTQQGLYRHGAGGAVERLAIADRAARVPVWASAFQGRDLWIGGLDGVWKVALEAGRPVRVLRHESASLGDTRVTSLLPAADGSLWIGTKAGLAKIDGASGKVQRVSGNASAGGLAPGYVSSMLMDRRGRLWISIFGAGVAVLERTDEQGQPRFRQLGVADGLPHSGVNALREDAHGFVWASTDDGLARIDPATYAIRALGWGEGVKIASYWTNSSIVGASGELMFGGASGLTVVRPARLAAWRYQAPVVLTAVSVNDASIASAPFFQGGAGPGKPAAIRITPAARERGFAVEFAALDFSAPERNRYAYRLLGFDKEWISSDASLRRASYNNLPPGDYTLQLRGANRDGLWSAPLEVAVRADPLWHQRGAVRSVAALAFAALLAGLLQARTAYLQRKRRELQHMVEQRTAELQASRQQLEVMAYSDPLTGLPNRRHFTDELRHMGARAVREHNPFTLLLIDLDHFKQINDTIGHDAGDALLIEAARRMKLCVREADRLARLGGDEFAVLLSNTGDYATLDAICGRIVASMAEPVQFGPYTLHISASIGAATFDPFQGDLDQLYKHADLALYATKGSGRNGWRRFDGRSTAHQASPHGVPEPS
jgi:diguanylate cyclase (GGDEF)-like protein